MLNSLPMIPLFLLSCMMKKPPGDSTVNQLIAITHQIHVAFEVYPSVVFEEYRSRETRAVFFYISKAFYKVWHGSLLHKL